MDINCDLGESMDFGHDEALMQYIHSANIACGSHAGDEYTISKTVENARKYGLNIGAHPGFNDKVNFGRIEMELPEYKLRSLITHQLKYFEQFAGKIHHVKPHGALYNMSARRQDYSRIIAEEVYDFDPGIILYGLSGSESIKEAEKIGLKTRSEVFADRAYLSDGSLAPRSREGAVLQDKKFIEKQIQHLVNGSAIETLDGLPIVLKAETICVHSDTAGAAEIAELVFKTLNGFATCRAPRFPKPY